VQEASDECAREKRKGPRATGEWRLFVEQKSQYLPGKKQNEGWFAKPGRDGENARQCGPDNRFALTSRKTGGRSTKLENDGREQEPTGKRFSLRDVPIQMREVTRAAQRPCGQGPTESFNCGRFAGVISNKPGQMSAYEGENASGHEQIQDSKAMFVFAAQELENQVHERRQRTIDVANVAIQDVAVADGPREILENALVAAER